MTEALPARYPALRYLAAGLPALLCLFLAASWLSRWWQPARNDFSVFYLAGELTAHGHLALAYNQHYLFRHETLMANTGHRVRLPFLYPPSMAFALCVLARLPLHVAYVVWTLANLTSFGVAAGIAVRRLAGSRRRLAILAIAGCIPILVSTVQGEDSGVLTLGIAFAVLAFDNPRLMVPALLLLSIKPQLALPVIILLLLRHRRAEWVAAAFTGSVLLGLGLLAGGLHGYQLFLSATRQAMNWTTQYNFGPSNNDSVVAQVHALAGYGLASTISVIILSLLVVGLLILAWRSAECRWIGLATATVLLANHLPFHDIAVVYPPAVLAVGTRLRPAAILVLLSPWLDPALYPLTHVHASVIAICILLISAASLASGPQTPESRMGQAGRANSACKSSGRRRWVSASESATPSR